MQQEITSFHQDEIGDWVALLTCGHTQHVRHDPPLTNRPWVGTKNGRAKFLGHPLECKHCDEPAGAPLRTEPAESTD